MRRCLQLITSSTCHFLENTFKEVHELTLVLLCFMDRCIRESYERLFSHHRELSLWRLINRAVEIKRTKCRTSNATHEFQEFSVLVFFWGCGREQVKSKIRAVFDWSFRHLALLRFLLFLLLVFFTFLSFRTFTAKSTLLVCPLSLPNWHRGHLDPHRQISNLFEPIRRRAFSLHCRNRTFNWRH